MIVEDTFGALVKKERVALGWEQAELARHVGCGTLTLRRIEADELRPSVQLAERLARTLGLPADKPMAHILPGHEQISDLPNFGSPPGPAQIGREDLSGLVIRGFALGRRVGLGGFGAVYQAVQTTVGREVAIKIILPMFADHPDFIRRFESEAQLVARLEHPHIVPLYDYWREPGGAYLVMRLLRGGNLAGRLSDGPMPLPAVLPVLDQICAALHAAHCQGVVHRDIKPANVLLDEENNAYLADFGIAKDLQLVDDTDAGTVLGSLFYIAPEQILTEPVQPQTDLYSLAILLYEMLTGARPFTGPSPVTLMQQQLNEALPLLSAQLDLPPAIDRVMARATAKSPEKRYPDVPHFLTALKRSLADHPLVVVAAEPKTPDESGAVSMPVLENPFKGLRPFAEADAAHFFGRDALVQTLLARLGEENEPVPSGAPNRARFLAVVGPSGSGKSSVVRAGLLPALRRGGLPGSENWFITRMTPGAQPWEALNEALRQVAINPPASLQAQLAENERGLLEAVNRILPADGVTELLLVVDQFEELFTLVETESARASFLDGLIAAALEPGTRIRIVITLRADFTDRPLQYAAFGELMRQRVEFVLPLQPAELEQAICGPLAAIGQAIDPNLVQAIIRDVGGQPGTLPLLQYGLTELFERRLEGGLSLGRYRERGGVLGALGRRAEAIYAEMEPGAQETVRQLFLRLVTLGEGVEDARRRVTRSELTALTPALTVVSQESIPDIIDRFGRYRLLTFDHHPISRGPTVEVAHEALLREWPRLRQWLDESRHDIRMQRRLAQDGREWMGAGRGDGFLLRGARLEQFAGWLAETNIVLTPTERDFLEASIEARTARRAAEAERQRRELETARQLLLTETQRAEEHGWAASQLRRRAYYLAMMLVLALALALAAGIFGQQAVTNANLAATRQVDAETAAALADQAAAAEAGAAAEALAHQVVAEQKAREALEAFSQSLAAHALTALENKDTAAALALAIAANEMENPPAIAQRVLREAAYAPGPRRQYLIAELFPDVEGRVYSLAMSPVAAEALIGFEDGTLILWDVAAEMEIHRLRGHSGTVRAVAFSPDGQMALSGGSDKAVILWDLGTGIEMKRFAGHHGWVRTVAFNPDGVTALSGGFVGESVSSVVNPGELFLWDLETGIQVHSYLGHPSGVVAAAFTPDGRSIITSSGFAANVDNEYGLSVWNVATGAKVREFEISGQTDNFGLDVSPDGQSVLTANSSNEVLLWDSETGKLSLTLEGHVGVYVTSVVFTPDGRRAISGDANGLVILWDLANGDSIMRTSVQKPDLGGWQADDAPVLNLAMSNDGRNAISSAGDGTLVVWDLADAGEIRRFAGHESPVVTGVAFTPDGQKVLTGEMGTGFGFSFGPSNRMRLFDVTTGLELRSFAGHTSGILMIAVSPDGRKALTGSEDGTIRLWDLVTGAEIHTIFAHTSGVFSVAMSPDGRLALSGSMADDFQDSGISLWDLESGQLVRRIVDHSHFTTLLFANDGQTFYSGIPEEDFHVFGQYDTNTGEIIRRYNSPRCCTGFIIHPDGQSVFIAHNSDGPVIEWDLVNDREIRTFGQHPGSRTRVDVSPDGRLLMISALSFDGGILSLWDLESGEEIRRFSSDGLCCMDIDIGPDGRTAITPGGGGTAILWDLTLPVLPDAVREWLAANRYVRPLTCAERELYQIGPLCTDDGPER